VRNVPVPEAHVVCLAAGFGLSRLRPWRLPGRGPVRRLLGWAAAGAGGYLVVRSVRAAARVDLARPDRLVTTYPYSVSRNPMYLGWTLLHLGGGLLADSGWIVATLPAAAGWIRLDIRREERRLAEALGPQYERYRTAVPRYFAVSSQIHRRRASERGTVGIRPTRRGVRKQGRDGGLPAPGVSGDTPSLRWPYHVPWRRTCHGGRQAAEGAASGP
jgi:protein-S-isoprenylcysteine O-methyltransferase Ste14